MASIANLIANPTGFDYRTLADPFAGYQQGVGMRREQDLMNATKNGLPRGPDGQVDFKAAIDILAKSGQVGPALTAAQGQQQLQLGQQANQSALAAWGLGGGTPQGAAPQSPMVPQGTQGGLPAPSAGNVAGTGAGGAVMPRQSGANYVGMDEGVRMGLYDPEPGAGQPQPQPQQMAQAAPAPQPQQPAGGLPPIGALMAGLADPSLPKGTREIGMEMLKARLNDPNLKMTPEQKEFMFARAQGDPEAQGGFTSWMRSNKRSGAAQQNVTVGGGRFGTIPPGYELVEGPNGAQMRAIPGGPAAREAEERATKAANATAGQRTQAENVISAIDGVEKLVEASPALTTGVGGAILSRLPSTSASDAGRLLDTVKANISFKALNDMRAASPTGGALGNVTERELELLQATIASLEQSQSTAQFKQNLKIVKDQFAKVIHGPNGTPKSGGAGKDGWTEIDGVKIRVKP